MWGGGAHVHVCKKKVFFRKSENHEKPATFRQKSAIFWALCALKKKIPRAQRAAKISTQKTFTTCRQNARFSLDFLWVTLTFFFQNGGEYFMENHRLWCKTFNNNSGQEQRETWKFLFSSSWSVLDCDPLPTTNMASEYDLIVPCTYLFKFVLGHFLGYFLGPFFLGCF